MSRESGPREKQIVKEEETDIDGDILSTHAIVSKSNSSVKRARSDTPATKINRKQEASVDHGEPHGLMAIPVEVFMEIASLTDPKGLLSLARCCKTLRKPLMEKSAAAVWRAAESNVLGLPNCPDDMSPPSYAALLFTKVCTVCGMVTNSKADPFLRVRLCGDCRETHLTEACPDWRDPYRNLEVVSVTTLIRLKAKDAPRRPNGSGVIAYCLLQEAENFIEKEDELADEGDSQALKDWRISQHKLIRTRYKFGKKLEQFLLTVSNSRLDELNEIKEQRRIAVDERLQELGWLDEDLQFESTSDWQRWTTLVDHPKPLTERIWTNLLPKIVPVLEANRIKRLRREKEERKTARDEHLNKLLQDLKPSINPFANLLAELGIDPSQPPDDSVDLSTYPSSLVDYPFPDSAVVIKWGFFEDIDTQDLSIQELTDLFHEHQEEIVKKVGDWRAKGERELISWWNVTGYAWGFSPSNFIFGYNGITSKVSPSNRDILLRADTIFADSSPGGVGGQGRPQHYPDFLVKRNGNYRFRLTEKMNTTVLYRHQEAEGFAKALLESIGLQNATYHALQMRGAVFICEKCEDKESKTWDEILNHYLEEKQIWDTQMEKGPIVKTKHSTAPKNTHSSYVSAYRPLVRLLDEAAAVPPTFHLAQTLDCLLCKNHRRRLTVKNFYSMENHLRETHYMYRPLEGLTHESSMVGVCFHDRGSKWRKEWGSIWDSHNDI